MARRQHAEARTAYGRRMQGRADDQRVAARANYVAAGTTALGAGVSFGTGNLPLGGGFLSMAVATARQGMEHQAAGRAINAKGRAVEDLVARRQGWDLRSNVNRNNEPVRAYARVLGASETRAPTAAVSRLPGAPSPAMDALAYAAGSASVVAGGQMARDVRKGARASRAATDNAVLDAKGVADGAKARGMRKADLQQRFQAVHGYAASPRMTKAELSGAIDKTRASVVGQPASRVRTAVAGYKAEMTAKAAPGASALVRATLTMAKANPFMMAAGGSVAASNAWNAARSAGASKSQAAGAAAVAAAPMAAAMAAPTLLGRMAPKAAGAIAKAALPLMAISTGLAAFRGGQAAYASGEGAVGVAKGAAMGAADSLTFGLASAVRDRMTGRSAGPDKAAAVAQVQADMGGTDRQSAYISAAARAKAETAPEIKAAPAAAQAQGPDGMTAGYTRTDPRTGRKVTVAEYRTPTR